MTTYNPLADHLGYQLRRASSRVFAVLAERLATVGLTIVETSVLILIDHNPGIIQSEVGRVLGINRANVAPLVNGLRHRGLVAAQANGRQSELTTTPPGKEVASAADRIMRNNDARFFATLPRELRDALTLGLSLIWNAEDGVADSDAKPIGGSADRLQQG